MHNRKYEDPLSLPSMEPERYDEIKQLHPNELQGLQLTNN